MKRSIVVSVAIVTTAATITTLSPTLRHDLYKLTDQALILGPTGIPTPNSAYIDGVVNGYLDPSGYTGGIANAEALTTPEQFSNTSYIQGEADVIEKLAELQQNGDITATDPEYLFGYSQSSTILSTVDSHLNDPSWIEGILTNPSLGSDALSASDAATTAQVVNGIGPSDLHLALVGDPAADPGDGVPPGFDNADFTQPWLKLFGYTEMMGVNSNNDLSPTDVYTVEGDNWAQASQFLGIPSLSSWQHLSYLGLDAGNFSPLDTVGNTDYFNAVDNSFNPLTALWDAALIDLGILGVSPV